MKRTTIFIDEEIDQELKLIARQKGKRVSEIIREAIDDYLSKHKKHKKCSFVGLGNSNRSDISENHEEDLWKK